MTVDSIKGEELKKQEKEVKDYEEAQKAQKAKRTSDKFWEQQSTQNLKIQAEATKMAMKREAKMEQDMEEVRKKAIYAKISRYIEAFPFLQGKIPKIGAKISLLELEEILYIIRSEMDSQRSLVQLQKYADFGFYALGAYWGDGSKLTALPPQLRLNLTGIQEYHKRGLFNDQLGPILMEIDIEYPWLGRQSLLFRTLEAVTEVMMKTHIINTNPEARKLLGLEKEPPKDVPGMEKL